MAAAHVFVADLDAPELAPDDVHHLLRVLRVGPSEEVTASDGAGRAIACRLVGGRLEPVGQVLSTPRPEPAITVAFALTKGDRPEWVVQKLTEAGVDRVVPFVAARSVVRWDDTKQARNAQRFRRVAREAAMQSRRLWLPEIDGVADFETVAAIPGVALADAGGDPPTLRLPALAVGPEGGWSDDERAVGLPRIALGQAVYRAETAALAAGMLLGALRTGLIGEGVATDGGEHCS